MWTGQIARTERHGSELSIIVSYTNGDNTFDETIVVGAVQPPDWLNNQIQTRIIQLNALDDYEVQIKADPALTSVFAVDQGELTLTPVTLEEVK